MIYGFFRIYNTKEALGGKGIWGVYKNGRGDEKYKSFFSGKIPANLPNSIA